MGRMTFSRGHRGLFLVAAVALLAGIAASLPAVGPEDYWPQWRGPNLDGTSSTASKLPAEWSETKNVKWRIKLPSWSAATPIIWGDTVYVTSAQEGFQVLQRQYRRGEERPSNPGAENDEMYLLAIRRSSGEVKWTREMGSGNRLYRKQNLASPSPVTDGHHIWTFTGAGTLTCFDMEGKQLWRREIEKEYGQFGLNHGYGSSSMLHEGRLYIQVLHGMKTDEPSYVFAVDAKTGKTVWKVDRWTDAQSESPDDYSTPILVTVDGKLQLVVSGGDYVTGHDLDTGKELWRMGGLNPENGRAYRTIASSITTGGVIFTTSTRGKPFIAFRPGGSGDITESHLIWKNDLGSDVPTPTTDGKRIFVVNDRGIMVALDAKTGDILWDRQRLEPGTYSSSPILADGKIYATSEDGTTTVVSAGDEFEILAVNKLNSHTLATPAPAGNELYIRTADYLYCISMQ